MKPPAFGAAGADRLSSAMGRRLFRRGADWIVFAAGWRRALAAWVLAGGLVSAAAGLGASAETGGPIAGGAATAPSPAAPVGLLSAGPAAPLTFRPYEIALGAEAPAALPYRDGPGVTATFVHASGDRIVAPGFWDGSNVWRIRFAPTRPGVWEWSTRSSDPGLNGVASNLTAAAPGPAEVAANVLLRGFLERDGHGWRLSDGSPFLPVGDTQFSFAEELFLPEFQAWMNALEARGLNTVQGCVWLSLYTRGGLSPFRGAPAADDLDPAYFQRLDQMVQYANDRGIMVGLVIGGFPDNSKWWTKLNTIERDDRWFSYALARYAAFNVRWVLYGEVDEANPPWGAWSSEVQRKAQLVKSIDPYRHPLGCHHRTADTSNIANPNIDFLEVQIARNETQYTAALGYRAHGKPLWFEEYWYESAGYDNETALGIRNTHRNFIAALAFPTFGSLMRAHATHSDFPPARAAQLGMNLEDYLLQKDTGLRRMQQFADFMRGLDPTTFQPAAARVNRGQCGQFGSSWALFLPGGGAVSLDLTGVPGEFDVRRLEIQQGNVLNLGRIQGGGVRLLVSRTLADASILVVPAAPRLADPRLMPDQTIAFQLLGENERAFDIEHTADFRVWTAISRVVTSDARCDCRASLPAGGSEPRFFRAVSVPGP
ncbi:MAG TPA: DUF5060 domain-containing protein [Candidatus Paceibacterota bacterium]|nr:DUF5060 domain-containing protein [Verrucomicrobiota bacterium]HRZ46141.1 DUF5060 domain-containing protein [Candidatus Paceibacterota bacterium]